MHYFRSLVSLLSILALSAGIAAFAADPVLPDNVGFIGDTLIPKAYAVPAFSAPFPDLTEPVADMAVDRANGRLYVLTATKLKAYNIDLTTGTPVLASATTPDDRGAPVSAEVPIGGLCPDHSPFESQRAHRSQKQGLDFTTEDTERTEIGFGLNAAVGFLEVNEDHEEYEC